MELHPQHAVDAGRRNESVGSSQEAVWPDFVVVRVSGGQRYSGPMKGLKPALVEVVVAKPVVEVFAAALLVWAHALNQNETDAVS